LTRGIYGKTSKSDIYDWKYIEFLRGDPEAARGGANYHMRIARLPAGEIALLASSLPYLHATELVTLLPDQLASDVVEALPPEMQLQVFEELEEDRAARLLALMAPDVAADLLGRLDPDGVRRYLETLPRERGERLIDLLRYPEGTVGAIMTNDVVFASANLTVADAREALKDKLKEPDFVYFIHLCGRRRRGQAALRRNHPARSVCGERRIRVAADYEPLPDHASAP
jgi:Mg/Co/Ni transporter MgtE